MAFDQAATIPLTMATVALGLYGKRLQLDGGLGLTPPWEAGGSGKYAGEPILIISGASGVGQHSASCSPLVYMRSLLIPVRSHPVRQAVRFLTHHHDGVEAQRGIPQVPWLHARHRPPHSALVSLTF